MVRRFLILLAGMALSAGAVPGCRKKAAPKLNTAPTDVLVTVYPLTDIAKRVGGKYVNVSWIVAGGQSLREFMPDDDRKHRVGLSDLLIANGLTEPWAVDDSDDPFRGQRLVRLDRTPTAQTDPAASYLWLDPLVIKDAADELARRYTDRRPILQRFFSENAEQLKTEIDGLLNPYLYKFKGKKVIALSDDFSALTARLGIAEVRPTNGVPGRLSEATLRLLRETGAEQNVKFILISTDAPPAVQADLAARTGLKVIALDAYGSSSTPERDSYTELLQFDLQQLEALVQ